MSADGEDTFKAFIEIYNSALRLIGAANATGTLAAGAAFQAFEKRPEAQSSIKIIIGFFFAGIVAFSNSQMALFLAIIFVVRASRRIGKRFFQMGSARKQLLQIIFAWQGTT
jgi:hypothetical protein